MLMQRPLRHSPGITRHSSRSEEETHTVNGLASNNNSFSFNYKTHSVNVWPQITTVSPSIIKHTRSMVWPQITTVSPSIIKHTRSMVWPQITTVSPSIIKHTRSMVWPQITTVSPSIIKHTRSMSGLK